MQDAVFRSFSSLRGRRPYQQMSLLVFARRNDAAIQQVMVCRSLRARRDESLSSLRAQRGNPCVGVSSDVVSFGPRYFASIGAEGIDTKELNFIKKALIETSNCRSVVADIK
jgi:hypothetical protein